LFLPQVWGRGLAIKNEISSLGIESTPIFKKKSYGTEPLKMLYQPLNVDDDEIRLISLAGENSTEVSITIEHVSLINPPSYTALSYCWGDQSETQTISINGRKFQVTSNLEAAL